MARRQKWTPDTLQHMEFEQEWDGDTFTCVGVTNRKTGEVITDPAQCAALHERAMDNNKYKNLELVPAMLAALPAEEKRDILDEAGVKVGEEFRILPEFETDAQDELRVKAWQPRNPANRAIVNQVHATKRAEKIAKGKLRQN